MCHITGGGLPENLPRVLPDGLGIVVDTNSWTPDPLFGLIQEQGNVAETEMRRTFNMSVGFTMVVDPSRAGDLLTALGEAGEDVFILGEVTGDARVSFSS